MRACLGSRIVHSIYLHCKKHLLTRSPTHKTHVSLHLCSRTCVDATVGWCPPLAGQLTFCFGAHIWCMHGGWYLTCHCGHGVGFGLFSGWRRAFVVLQTKRTYRTAENRAFCNQGERGMGWILNCVFIIHYWRRFLLCTVSSCSTEVRSHHEGDNVSLCDLGFTT